MLTAGTRLGAYDILGPLGAGGMGEVHRARDTRLNRDVAIKILPDVFAADPDRMARFTREAQMLAALNHPNIAQIYGVLDLPPEHGSHTGLVMELVDGEDLSQRLARGRLPLDEALPIARQIADALEAAHEQGIVHRDLKPANIKVRPDGAVKVLDFGLAKAMEPAHAASSPEIANSPTLTAHATQVGMIIGTAAYMAPEQARGKSVDRRADIWAFGAVVFEMLTGRRAFEGDEISDVLASVLKSEPDWLSIPAGAPASIRRLLRRCLEKDPRKRLGSIADARLELDEQDAPVAAASAVSSGQVKDKRGLAAAVWSALGAAALTALVAGALWSTRTPAVSEALQRFSLLPPSGVQLYPDSTGVAISPDGTMVAFVVGDTSRSENQLWVRPTESLVARRLEDGDGAYLPFWSPDSRQIGFFAGTKLKIVAASGGRAQALADINGARGGTWGASNVIVYAPDPTATLHRVQASGGTPAAVTTLDTGRKQHGHRFPAFLPDGDHFMYATVPAQNGRFDIFVGSLAGGAPVQIGSMESAPVYADPGFLLFARQGVLMAQPFDVKALRLTGDPVTLEDEPSSILDPMAAYTAGRAVSVSSTGALAYYSSPSRTTVAEWYDVSGGRKGPLALPSGRYDKVRISPDGTRAVVVRSASASESSLWMIVDLARGNLAQLSTGPGRNDTPVWSPDGSRVIFASDRGGAADFYIKTVGDAAPEQPFFRSDAIFKGINAWTRDGKSILFTQTDGGMGQNIYRLAADGAHESTQVVNGPSREIGRAVSPDGRWLAYASDETGRYQLYVQPFPGPGPRVQVSQDGAADAWWTDDGRQLLWTSDGLRALWRADVTADAAFSAGTPVRLAQLPPGILDLDLAPDRQRFLALAPDAVGPGSMTVVEHWRAALERKR